MKKIAGSLITLVLVLAALSTPLFAEGEVAAMRRLRNASDGRSALWRRRGGGLG